MSEVTPIARSMVSLNLPKPVPALACSVFAPGQGS